MDRKYIGKVLAALLLSVPLVASAASNGSPWKLGARLGTGFVDVLTDADWDIYSGYETEEDTPLLGGDLALSFDVALNVVQNLYLHSGVGLDFRYMFSYCEEMYMEGTHANGSQCEDRTSLFYLEIPLMAQWKIPDILFLEVGPVFDILLYANEDSYSPKQSVASKYNFYENRRFGAGIVAGLGHEFSSGLSVDFRVTYQFTDLVDVDREKAPEHISNGITLEKELDNGEKVVTKIPSPLDEECGSYYKLLKFQLGVGYWF